MNTVNFKLVPNRCFPVTVFADGKALKMKKQKDRSYACEYRTENKSVEIYMCRISEVDSRWWWLTSILFFVFSCFGIFDAHYDKKCYALRYRCTVTLPPEGVSEVTLRYNPVTAGFKCVECVCGGECEEYENVYFTNEAAKKRLKKLRLIKILTWVGIIVIAALACVLSIFL